MTPRAAINPDWRAHLNKVGRVTLGLDLATTEKKTSNPAALSVIQEDGAFYRTRLIASWKTADPEVTTEIVTVVVNDILDAGCVPSLLSIDSSNEEFYAKMLAKSLRGKVRCQLIKGGENLTFEGVTDNAKTMLGNIYVNHIEEGRLLLPSGKWIEKDHRLVSKNGGKFLSALGDSGEHGDTFDAGKLALWGQLRKKTGTAKGVQAAQVGGAGKLDRLRRRFSRDPNRRIINC